MRITAALIFACVPALCAAPEGLPASLRLRVESARSPMLRWPDWSDYRAEVLGFYQRLGGRAAWVQDGAATPQARQLAARMADADLKGLNAADYEGDRWPARMAALSGPLAVEEFDVAFTVCVMRYVSDLQIGRINPARLGQGTRPAGRRVALPAFVAELASDADPGARLDPLEPGYLGYRALLDQLPRYLALARTTFPPLRAPRKLAPGGAFPAAAALAERLVALGDLDPARRLAPGRYDPALAEAVRRYQGRHGLDPASGLGPKTLAQLNTQPAQRLAQLRLTLERWRWVALDPGKRLIWVNIPAFNLAALTPKGDSFTWDLDMRVVVGDAYQHATHVLTGKLNTVVFRPAWNVPPSIVEHDILPALRKDPKYLGRRGYEIVRGYEVAGPPVPVTRASIQALAAGKLQLRQPPGKTNALGLVKLLFSNHEDIYLHDTPVRTGFRNHRRDDSHGCVRVEKPAELAAWVLAPDPAWSLGQVRAAMAAGGPSLKVPVPTPVQVMLVYATATVDGAGRVYFYDDVYGNDRDLAKALAAGYPYL